MLKANAKVQAKAGAYEVPHELLMMDLCHYCSVRRGPIALRPPSIFTSIKIIKNEVGCRDDTVPKTVDTRRHYEEE